MYFQADEKATPVHATSWNGASYLAGDFSGASCLGILKLWWFSPHVKELAGGRDLRRLHDEGKLELEGQVSGCSAPGACCRGPLSEDGGIPPTTLEETLGSFLLLPASPNCHLPEHISAITHCPPGRAEPHHFAGGAGCCQWQRRMTYLLACQNLPCLWKSHPAKQNSQLPIGSPRGPCWELQQSAWWGIKWWLINLLLSWSSHGAADGSPSGQPSLCAAQPSLSLVWPELWDSQAGKEREAGAEALEAPGGRLGRNDSEEEASAACH